MECLENQVKNRSAEGKNEICETANDNRCCFAKYKKNDMVLFNDMCTKF